MQASTLLSTSEIGDHGTSATKANDVSASASPYLDYIYDGPKDDRNTSTSIKAGESTSVSLGTLKPSTTYQICSALTTADSSVTTDASCSTITTPSTIWTVRRVLLMFSSNQTAAQRNDLLCAFCSLVGVTDPAQFQYVLNRQGESCDPSRSSPALFWYAYRGDTYDNSSQTLYFVLTDNSTQSQAQNFSFGNLFDPTTKLLTPFAQSALSNRVSHTLNKGLLLEDVSYALLRDDRREFGLKILNGSAQEIALGEIAANGSSAVYFTVQDKAAPTPSNEQVLNCLDGNGNKATRCFRYLSNGATALP